MKVANTTTLVDWFGFTEFHLYLIRPRIDDSRHKQEIQRCNTCCPCIGKFHTSLLDTQISLSYQGTRFGSLSCILKMEKTQKS